MATYSYINEEYLAARISYSVATSCFFVLRRLSRLFLPLNLDMFVLDEKYEQQLKTTSPARLKKKEVSNIRAVVSSSGSLAAGFGTMPFTAGFSGIGIWFGALRLRATSKKTKTSLELISLSGELSTIRGNGKKSLSR